MQELDRTKAHVLAELAKDQGEQLRFMANLDLRLVFGYLSAQFILVGWVTQQASLSPPMVWGILLVNALLYGVILLLLIRHGRRRHQAAQTMRNIDEALGLFEPGFYFEGVIKQKVALRERHPLLHYWHPIYILVCSVAFCIVTLLLALSRGI